MNEKIDHHLEMQETNYMLLQQFEKATELQEQETQNRYYDHSDLSSPTRQSKKKERIVEQLLANRARFNDRTALFNLVNTLQLVNDSTKFQAITLYNLSSIINIEGQSNLKFYDTTQIYSFYVWNQQGSLHVYYLIIIYNNGSYFKIINVFGGLFLCCIKK
ncbi:unnamed protein product (macronuclear) [Paramecium tetraurelia]|uniref:Uncharacterized protein n=1 Tax=Paramecium tetraurelia TaxID=5888 RepID=A0C2E2_PARTE|nr:uncharacterized protein GSPATT00034437001 [Paramecium tetraurelia]CAK64959.1 unnamed protein product [Paramecium tetraurelia]|eukprot:XP_001432356.1 hypothetical protein (macronuclear) [Paramecium tetraurelia strain d4-2]